LALPLGKDQGEHLSEQRVALFLGAVLTL